jgi:outer membrane protein assembly factor BamD (BamD/ComL family)
MAEDANAQEKYSISNKRAIKIYEQGRDEYAAGNYQEAKTLLEKALKRELKS